MGLTKVNIGSNEDGSPRFQYVQDPLDPDKPVMYTGPIKGTVELDDGSTVDVTEDYVELDSHEHAGAVNHAIGVHYEDNGHPAHTDGTPFYHLCTETCGAAARPASHPQQAEAIKLAQAQLDGLDDDHPSKPQLTELLKSAKGGARRRRNSGGEGE